MPRLQREDMTLLKIIRKPRNRSPQSSILTRNDEDPTITVRSRPITNAFWKGRLRERERDRERERGGGEGGTWEEGHVAVSV